MQFPVPGAENTGEGERDVADAGEAPFCRLKLQDVKELKKGVIAVSVFLEVEGAPFDLERFELVDGKGRIWENART